MCVRVMCCARCSQWDRWSTKTSHGGLLVLRRRLVAGLDEEFSSESCGNDVRDVLAVEQEEPVDNSGTMVGTWFSVLHLIFLQFFFFFQKLCLTTGPLIGYL